MGLNKTSKIREIMDTPGGREVLEKYWPGSTSDPSFQQQAMELPVKLLTTFPESRLEKDVIQQLYADLEALG